MEQFFLFQFTNKLAEIAERFVNVKVAVGRQGKFQIVFIESCYINIYESATKIFQKSLILPIDTDSLAYYSPHPQQTSIAHYAASSMQ